MANETAPQSAVEQCPQCGAQLPEGSLLACPYCGTRLPQPASTPPGARPLPGVYPIPPAILQRMYGHEYRSRATLFGWPLVHIAQGFDPQTGRPRIARGIIAVGNVAIGVVALGGVAIGGIAIGGVAVGVLALAGMAAGIVALGGMAAAVWLALGGMAISAQYAIGGLALAPHALGGNAWDPVLWHWLEQLFGLGSWE
jgi:hypothetical protein